MVHLNLGSGDYPAPAPWVNVDSWAGNRPDVVADLRQLPFPTGTAQQVYCGHVLEHLTLDDVPIALAEIRRALGPNGALCVVGPDCDRADTSGDEVLIDLLRDGGDRWPGDRHLWRSTEDSTLRLVRQEFADVVPIPIEDLSTSWPVVSRVWWQFALLAA